MLHETLSPRQATPQAYVWDALTARVRAEFIEMPGLRLTPRQGARLWHVDLATSAAVLARLNAERFLTRTAAGAYVRP
ncbi:MAG: hypothetical protein AB1635_08500 [Acidobacteriota bacterium]